MSAVPGWNFADVWEQVADRFGGEPAAVDGDRELRWGEFDRRADGIGRTLIDAGLPRQATVAKYLRNCAEYMESMFGMFKFGMVPVNTNLRYGDDELVYLWNDCDAAAVIFAAEFTEVRERIRPRVPSVRVWLQVSPPGGEYGCPEWAVPYEEAASSARGRVRPPWGRSGDDLYLPYTGRTTGLPKGVMWRQDDLFQMLEAVNGRVPPDPPTSLPAWPASTAKARGSCPSRRSCMARRAGLSCRRCRRRAAW